MRLSLEHIARAAREIDAVFINSPQFVAESLGQALGTSLLVKVETANPIRSFKGRGADFFLHELGGDPVPLVCASAGNFGQGMAYACRRRGRALDVFASHHANPLKIDRMRALGATVHLAGDDFDAAKDAARDFAAARGAWFVEDGRVPAISEGAGTIGVELLARGATFDTLVVPLGNGALLGGVATWVRAHAPGVRIVGVCASGAPSMERSWRAQTVIETTRADTIADGIGVRVPIAEAIEDLHDVIDDVILVEDVHTIEAMRLVLRHLGTVVEPAGAIGVGALIATPQAFAGARIATILCGGNVTPAQGEAWGLVV